MIAPKTATTAATIIKSEMFMYTTTSRRGRIPPRKQHTKGLGLRNCQQTLVLLIIPSSFVYHALQFATHFAKDTALYLR
jgi:hypothetical protein